MAGSDRGGRTIYLAESQGAGPMDPRPLAGHIRSIGADGKHRTFGDLAALEVKHNADGGTSYGFKDLPAACAKQLPKDVEVSYKGHIDSHPYGIEVYGNTIYVADAGANSIVSVDVKSGKAETGARAAAPTAQIHHKRNRGTETSRVASQAITPYRFEPVPTDVERGPDGWLRTYRCLPGGPEDPALGARERCTKGQPPDRTRQAVRR